jgi:hypothetical protein
MGRSNDFRDVIQNSTEPAAFEKESSNDQIESLQGPEFQLKENPVQKEENSDEEELIQSKMNPVQKQPNEEEDEEPISAKMNPVQKAIEEEKIQEKKATKKPYQLKTKEVASASTGMASKLPAQLKENMESSLGGDFSNTEIYANSTKATKMGALAYAQGNEIHFAPGKYDPESQGGKELIGHELTHIIQQKKGIVQKTKNDNGMQVNNEFKLEKEADDLGKKAADSSFEDAPRKHDQSYEQFITDQPSDNNK